MRPRQIQIGGRTIGDGSPCFIVAEAGSNHNGNLDHALAIIDAAKQSQADAVRFTTSAQTSCIRELPARRITCRSGSRCTTYKEHGNAAGMDPGTCGLLQG